MRRYTRPGIICLGILSSVVALESSASAQDITNAFRLGFEGVLFSQDSMTVSRSEGTTPTIPPGSGVTPAPNEITVKSQSAGVLPSGMGLGLGFAPSSNVVLGLHMLAVTTKTEVDMEGSKPASSTDLSVMPSIELLASSGSVRPFVDVRFGFRSASTEVDGEETSKTSALALGGGAGVHLFANDHVSIDPGFHAYFLSGSYKSGELEMDGRGYTVMMSLALSAWIGGRGSVRDPVDRVPPTPSEDSTETTGSSATSPSHDEGPVQTSSRRVDTTIRVGDQSTLVIAGVPDKNGDAMLMQWRVTGQPPWKRECKTLKLVLDGTDYPLDKVGRKSGGEAHNTWMGLGGQIGAHTVLALSEAKESRLVACNASLGLFSVRKYVADYVERFREAATNAGTWQDPEPQAAPQPESQPADASAQPSSDAAPVQPPAPETPAPAADAKKPAEPKNPKPKGR